MEFWDRVKDQDVEACLKKWEVRHLFYWSSRTLKDPDVRHFPSSLSEMEAAMRPHPSPSRVDCSLLLEVRAD